MSHSRKNWCCTVFRKSFQVCKQLFGAADGVGAAFFQIENFNLHEELSIIGFAGMWD